MNTWPGTSIPESTRNAFDWLDQAALDFDARPRYKALGNSWAVNCARWIGERIEAVETIVAEQAELETA